MSESKPEGNLDAQGVPFWKRVLVAAYYQVTRPYRFWLRRHLESTGQAPVVVLFYHRVTDELTDDCTCARRTFERQMLWLKDHFDMVTMAEAQRRIRSGRNERACVHVTFDDGYAVNSEFAIPLLVRLRIPCTYFVTAQQILEGRTFPHDQHATAHVQPNTIDELKWMIEQGIEIGAHSRTHCDLGAVFDPARLYDEVVAARDDLQHELGVRIRYFAYPYGMRPNLSREVFRLAHDADYEGVCSAYGGLNFPGDDPFHIQRIHGDVSMARFKNNLTFDPRKLHIERYPYVSPAKTPEPGCP